MGDGDKEINTGTYLPRFACWYRNRLLITVLILF
jgi:hypothetical protein